MPRPAWSQKARDTRATCVRGGNSLFTGVWGQQERPTWQGNHTRTLARSSDTPGPGPTPALCHGVTYTLHQPQETEERLKLGDTTMPDGPQPVSLFNTYKCTQTHLQSAVSQSPPSPAVQREAPPQPGPKPWWPRHPPLSPQLRLSRALQQQHCFSVKARHRHPPTPAGPIPEDVGRPEPGPTQPAEPTDSQTSDSQSLHTYVRFGTPPGPVHTHPVPLQPAPSQVPRPPRGPDGTTSRQSPPAQGESRLEAHTPRSNLALAHNSSLRSKLRPSATRQVGALNRNLGQASRLCTVSTLDAPSPRTGDTAPFLF